MVDVIAWAVAGAFALVMAAFVGFELRWKSNRLRNDLAELQAIIGQLRLIQAEFSSAGSRLASAADTVGRS